MSNQMDKHYQWAVIGAGPAGIAAVGQLMDHGIPSADIVWIDPKFEVGDFGLKWREVSSNTKVALFNQFFQTCRAFNYKNAPKFAIQGIDPEDTCLIQYAVEPLQWITGQLKQKLNSVQDKVIGLTHAQRTWILNLEQNQRIQARNVIMALGAEPVSLSYPSNEEIPLAQALCPSLLPQLCHPDDKVAVFGSSHSAILILKTLIEKCKLAAVYNVYRSPLCYAVYYDDWILFDDSGLKGIAAEWARENIDGHRPKNLHRVLANEDNVKRVLALCSKVIYATGFNARNIPIEGFSALTYNQRSGIIAPGLFGLGIAFPEANSDRFGNMSYRIGLWKFMDYLLRVMPVWLKYTS